MSDPDEWVEPYAQLVNSGRFVVRREMRHGSPGRFFAWLADRVAMIAAAEGKRQVPQEIWLGLVAMALAAIPEDADWDDLVAWMRPGDGRPDTPDKIKQRQRDLVEATSGHMRRHTDDESRRAAAAELRQWGYTDKQIADELGITTKDLARLRSRKDAA